MKRVIALICTISCIKSINGAKFDVVGMSCESDMQVELKGFRWDCSDPSCYEGEAYLTGESKFI